MFIGSWKFNVCLEYHIKNCAGPCVGKQSQEEYLNNIAEIKEILKGNTQEVGRMLYRQMQDLAAEMEYYVSIPLYNLSDDTYEVYVRFGGELYDSGETFTIHSRR